MLDLLQYDVGLDLLDITTMFIVEMVEPLEFHWKSSINGNSKIKIFKYLKEFSIRRQMNILVRVISWLGEGLIRNVGITHKFANQIYPQLNPGLIHEDIISLILPNLFGYSSVTFLLLCGRR